MMDSRQLIKNILTKQPAKRMGFRDNIWPETEVKWRAQGYMVKSKEGGGEPENISFNDWFDSDMYERWNINTQPIMGYREVIEESDEWIITKNGAGAVFKNWKNRTGVPEHMDFEMNSREIWEEKYKPYLTEFQPERVNLDEAKEFLRETAQRKKFSSYGNIFIWELLRSSLGDVQMFENLLDDPDWIEDFNRTYTDFFQTYLKYLFDNCGIPDGVWLYDDLAYNKGLFCSPTILKEHFVPFYKEMTDFLHSYHIPVILHSCGNVEMALPLIVESGFDALNPMEVKAGCDVVRFAEKYGDKLSFVGGFDVRILEDGDKTAIKKEVLRICDTMRRLKVGYVFGTDHSITPNVEYESYQYALDVFQENMYY